MTGCSALFCNNSSDKGYIMKVFPKDVKRRAEWAEKVGRKDWTPSDRCYLCEVHFTPESWENRADGKPKLKPNAVPTIFGYWLKKRSWNTNQNQQVPQVLVLKSNSENHQHVSDNSDERPFPHETLQTNKERESQRSSENSTALCGDDDVRRLPIEVKPENVFPSTSGDDGSKSVIEHYEKIIEKQRKIHDKQARDIFILRKKVKALYNGCRKYEKKFSKDKFRVALKRIFNEDQIRALFTKRRTTRNWSKDTIRHALRLKFACGTNGYEELLRQKIPLPSLRTLRRKLENS